MYCELNCYHLLNFPTEFLQRTSHLRKDTEKKSCKTSFFGIFIYVMIIVYFALFTYNFKRNFKCYFFMKF